MFLLFHLNMLKRNQALVRIWRWFTLWWTNIAMENHHFKWEHPLYMAIFDCYVSSPEGTYIYVTCGQFCGLKTKVPAWVVWPRSTSKRDQLQGEVDFLRHKSPRMGEKKEPINSSIPIWCSVPHIPKISYEVLWLSHLNKGWWSNHRIWRSSPSSVSTVPTLGVAFWYAQRSAAQRGPVILSPPQAEPEVWILQSGSSGVLRGSSGCSLFWSKWVGNWKTNGILMVNDG